MEGNITRVTRALKKKLNSIDCDILAKTNTPQKEEIVILLKSESISKRRSRQNSRNASTSIATMLPVLDHKLKCNLNPEVTATTNKTVSKPKTIFSSTKIALEEESKKRLANRSISKSPNMSDIDEPYKRVTRSISKSPIMDVIDESNKRVTGSTTKSPREKIDEKIHVRLKKFNPVVRLAKNYHVGKTKEHLELISTKLSSKIEYNYLKENSDSAGKSLSATREKRTTSISKTYFGACEETVFKKIKSPEIRHLNRKAHYKRIPIIDLTDSDIEITDDVDLDNKMEISDKTFNTGGDSVCSSKKKSILNICKEEPVSEDFRNNISQNFVKKNNLNQNKSRSIDTNKKTAVNKHQTTETEDDITSNFTNTKKNVKSDYQDDQAQIELNSLKYKNSSISKDGAQNLGASEESRKALKIKTPVIINLSFNRNQISTVEDNQKNDVIKNRCLLKSAEQENVTMNKNIIILKTENNKEEDFNKIIKSRNKSPVKSPQHKNTSFNQNKSERDIVSGDHNECRIHHTHLQYEDDSGYKGNDYKDCVQGGNGSNSSTGSERFAKPQKINKSFSDGCNSFKSVNYTANEKDQLDIVKLSDDVDIANKMEISDKIINTILTISSDRVSVCSCKKRSILTISREEPDSEDCKHIISQNFEKNNSLNNEKVDLNQNASSSSHTSQMSGTENSFDFSLNHKKLLLNPSNYLITTIEIDKKTQPKKEQISEASYFGNKNTNVYSDCKDDQIQSKIELKSPKNTSKYIGDSEESGLKIIKSPKMKNASYNKNEISLPEANEEHDVISNCLVESVENDITVNKRIIMPPNRKENDNNEKIEYTSETESHKKENFDKIIKNLNKSIVKTIENKNYSFNKNKVIERYIGSGEDEKYDNTIKNNNKSFAKSHKNTTSINKIMVLKLADDEIGVDCDSEVQHKTVNLEKIKESHVENLLKYSILSQKCENLNISKNGNISIESNQSDEQIDNRKNNKNGIDRDQFQTENINTEYNQHISKSKLRYSCTSVTEYKPVQQKNKLSKTFINDNIRVSNDQDDDSDNPDNCSHNDAHKQIINSPQIYHNHNLSEAKELGKLITNKFKIKANNRKSMIETNKKYFSSKKSHRSSESTHINCNNDIFQDLREKLSKNTNNSDKAMKSCSIDENVSCNVEENNIKLNQSLGNISHQKGTVAGDNFNQVTHILNRCDEILEAANRAKREAKLQNKLNNYEKFNKMKIKKKKFEENCPTSSDAPTHIKPHQKQIKEAAIIKALNYREIMVKNKTTHKTSQKPATSTNSRLLPVEVLDAIVNDPKIKKKALKDSHRQYSKLCELNDIENKSKSFNKLKRNAVTGIEIKAVTGIEMITPPKSKKIISKKIRSGTVYEEPITPESKKIMNGFKEYSITPKAIGFKLRRILSAGQKKSPALNLEKKLQKRKRKNIPEPNRSLPKTVWTSSGEFIEGDYEVSRKEIKLDESIATCFYVTPKQSTSCVKNNYFGINSNALEFKKNTMKSSKNRRESSKQMLQRKERQNIYNKF